MSSQPQLPHAPPGRLHVRAMVSGREPNDVQNNASYPSHNKLEAYTSSLPLSCMFRTQTYGQASLTCMVNGLHEVVGKLLEVMLERPQPVAAPICTSSEPTLPFKPKLTSKHERQGSEPTRRTSAMRALQPRIIAHTLFTLACTRAHASPLSRTEAPASLRCTPPHS